MPQVPNRIQTVISASGAVGPADGLFHITKAGVAALTLELPAVDAQRMLFIDETGEAHTITVAAAGSPRENGLNGALSADTTATFNGTPGSSIELVSRDGNWFVSFLRGVTLS